MGRKYWFEVFPKMLDRETFFHFADVFTCYHLLTNLKYQIMYLPPVTKGGYVVGKNEFKIDFRFIFLCLWLHNLQCKHACEFFNIGDFSQFTSSTYSQNRYLRYAVSHLSKRKSELNKTPIFSTVLHTLLHGVIHFSRIARLNSSF